MPSLAVVIPTTWPYSLISGPPELPGLMDTSVWIRVITRSSMVMFRLMAEIQPPESEFCSSSPLGLPMA